MYPLHPILIVEDNEEMLRILQLTLQSDGMANVIALSDSARVLDTMMDHAVGLVLLDLHLPGVEKYELLVKIRESHPEVAVIVITGENKLDTAVRCMRLGARDYLSKPVEPRRLMASVRQSLEHGELEEEYRTYIEKSTQDRLENPGAFEGILAESSSMRAVFQYVETIAQSRKPVLITGESGVGKELIARAVHRASAVTGPFISEAVAGYDDAMFSDALFGHVAGAYTGAANRRAGLVQHADSGTLFLDEIGDLSAPSQVKLLRLIQEREYRPLGGDKAQRTTARFVFATNRDLPAMRDAGTFRADLFYRISTHRIEIPPLRRRKRDIAPLVRHFVAQAARELGSIPPAIPQALFQLLSTYSFPGNVRELEAMVFDAVANTRGHSLSLALFEPHLAREETVNRVHEANEIQHQPDAGSLFATLQSIPTLAEVQEELITEAMRRAGGNQGIAARLLGISRTALNKRLHH